MSKIVVKYNNNLLNRSGNIFTGYDGTPICDFNADGSPLSQIDITIGDSLNFYDLSTKTPTSWNWDLGSGTPSSSSSQNPTAVQFNTTGLTDISLSVSNSFGFDTKTKSNYINVSDIQLNKLAINLYAPQIGASTVPYYTGLTWTPSGMSERTWTWNYLVSDVVGQKPTTGCTMALKYIDGSSSNYYIRVLTNFNESYTNGMITDNDTGIYPDNVLKYSLINISWDPMVKQYIRLSGLTTATTYKITILGSRGSFTATSRFTISGGTSKDGDYVTLQTNDNVMNTVSITGITPSLSGIIDIGLDWVADVNTMGIINAIEIEEGG